ncbi:MAG: CoA transferase [Solirubrobacterales bacterium]|nr:CoA transferase [Solirubrobacterales bacterium]MBV9048550.1 CoA transferase [Solirubrobacterales bacterium]
MDASTPGALSDLRILDFSRVLAGPFATMLLADLGATVTKVERPGSGDETRDWGPPFDERGEATYFQSVNRNKDSVAIDLRSERGSRRARQLAIDADVVVENFRPGVMDRLGLGYEQLSAEHPSLIYCSITAFGRGAGAELPGYDLLVQAMGGLMSITGPAEGEPQKVGVAIVDVLAGALAAVGILAALRHRDATEQGQLVEVNLFSALLSGLVNQGSAYTIAGVVPERMGNAHPSIAPYELFSTGSGELVLAVGNDRQFADLCEVLGVPELASDPRFATNSERVANRSELRCRLERQLAGQSAREWADALTPAGVPAGVVNDVAAAFEFAGLLGLEPVITIPRDDGTKVRLTRNPLELSRTPPIYRSGPPSLPEA